MGCKRAESSRVLSCSSPARAILGGLELASSLSQATIVGLELSSHNFVEARARLKMLENGGAAVARKRKVGAGLLINKGSICFEFP